MLGLDSVAVATRLKWERDLTAVAPATSNCSRARRSQTEGTFLETPCWGTRNSFHGYLGYLT